MAKIYIAGPMSGLPGFNRQAFNRAAGHVVRRGNVALNPAILPDGLEQAEYMDMPLSPHLLRRLFILRMANSAFRLGLSQPKVKNSLSSCWVRWIKQRLIMILKLH